jgi:uncharacterized protein
MHWIIHCLDHPSVAAARTANYEAHKAYLSRSDLPVRILVSGPLVADDGETPVGSFFLIEAVDASAVDLFRAGDPFKRAGIWRAESAHPFIKRQDVR